jgi:class 3 adenylate cyclase
MESLHSAMHEDLELDVLLPAAAVFEATGALEWDSLRQYLQMSLAMIAQRTLDEDVRVRWFRGPVGREMTRLAGPIQSVPTADAAFGGETSDGSDTALLRSLVQGKTNAEIAGPQPGGRRGRPRLGELFAGGAPPRAEAPFAFGNGSVGGSRGEGSRRPASVHRRWDVISIAPTRSTVRGRLRQGWRGGPRSVEDDLLREARWRAHGRVTEEWRAAAARAARKPRRSRTFMFTDIEGSTTLVDALGDEAWQGILRWHDETLRALFAEHAGEEVVATGDGFFIGFDSPDQALACAVAIQRRLAEHRLQNGFAPKVRIGVHASGATQMGRNFSGKGVHEASRIAALAGGRMRSLDARDTAAGGRFSVSEPREVTVRGISAPLEIVSVVWS